MITIYGKYLENLAEECNFFHIYPISQEYQAFYSDALLIIKDIVKKELSNKQKRLLLVFLENKRINDIAQILDVNHSTIHNNFNLIVKKISIGLVNDKKFLELIDRSPDYLKNKLYQWIEETKEKYRIKKYRCPLCNHEFDNKFDIKKHLLKNNDTNHKKYYKEQIKFIKKMLDKNGFKVDWIYKHNDYLLFSLSWIYNYWTKNYGKKTQGYLFKIFK